VTNVNLYNLSLRLFLAWLLLSIAGYYGGQQLVSFLLPFFSDVINTISHDYSHVLKIGENKGQATIEIAAMITNRIKATDTIVLSAGQTITASIHVFHVLVPLVILFTLVIAWPVQKLRDRIQILFLALPVTTIILWLTTPMLLAGHIEKKIMLLIQNVGGVPKEPFLLNWVIFSEMGGNWLLPVIGAATCIFMSKGIDNLRQQFHDNGKIGSTVRIHKKSRKEKKLDKRNRKHAI